jgi:hypothetical protein
MRYSMMDGLSFAEVSFEDQSGQALSEFNLTYGTPASIIIVDEDNVDTEEGMKVDAKLQKDPHTKEGYDAAWYMKSHEWVVIGVSDDSKTNTRTIQGVITILLAHPWFVYRDMKNHAFKPQRIDELVKEMLKDSFRGYKLPDPVGDNFDKTDDEGREPRYKIQETDYDFITQKLLPDVSILFDPGYFWVDYWGDYHLKSFSTLIKTPPKILFGPKQDESMEMEELGVLQKYIEDFGIKEDSYMVIKELSVEIYHPQEKDDFRKEFKPGFVLEDVNMNYQLIMGKRVPGTAMPGDNGKTWPILTPVNDRIQATSVKIGKNNLVDDSTSQLFADGKILNECFVIKIVSTFTGQFGLPGMTAQLYVSKVTYDGEEGEKMTADHWAEGKWLILATEHFIETEDKPHTVYTKTTLIRPTFLINNPDTSGLSLLQGMWNIP